MSKNSEHLRMVEALLFAAEEPLAAEDIAARLPEDADVAVELETLQKFYSGRGVNLVTVAGRYQFRTAPDLAFLLRREQEETRRLSRAAVETLAIIAYHQPVTRAEVEELRGVGLSKGTLDLLMAAGWVRPTGRRQTPGRPVTYGTTDGFLVHFGLESIEALPGVGELKAAGLLEPVDVALSRLEAADDDEDEADEDDEDDAPTGQIDIEDAIEASVRDESPDLA